ncbi:MAG TPA: DUF5302 domain-containing protein [Mycobacteriales bacterium]|nr:DUF5302 domain-containing protein [Mycobacteriales bacterium]
MSDESTTPDTADDDLHRKFREALERKKKAHHPSAALGEDGDGKTNAAKGSNVRKREFRRKSI